MSPEINPILLDLSKQLPDEVLTLKYIREFKNYREIAIQAQKEIFSLRNFEDSIEAGQFVDSVLQQNGYESWLKVSDIEDRLRVIGTLELIAELSEDLVDD